MSSNHNSTEARRRRRRMAFMRMSKVITTIAILFICSINVFLLHQNYFRHYIQETNKRDDGDSIAASHPSSLKNYVTQLNKVKSKSKSNNLAIDIVHKSFNATYASLIEICPNKKDESIKNCIQKMYDIIKSKNAQTQNNITKEENINTISWKKLNYNGQHWWYQSMIRDGGRLENVKAQGVQGPWHIGQAKDPNVSMCMIEKIAIKQWTKLFSRLNNNGGGKTRKISFGPPILLPDVLDEDDGDDKDNNDLYYPSFVFLRDPLDRFLSAYLDKCYAERRRMGEKHCEPNEIYNLPSSSINDSPYLAGFSFDDDKTMKVQQHHQEHVNKRTMFATYVDTMPLKWNLHFFPQSFYCNGLYRFIDKYDFVGIMDHGFYHNLEILGKRYGGRFEKELNDIFNYTSKKKEGANNNVGVETKASDKVIEFYTPRTLRRVLEYVSIDYVMLGLEIPDWAEAMLREDEDDSL